MTAHTYARDKALKVAAGAPALLAQARGFSFERVAACGTISNPL